MAYRLYDGTQTLKNKNCNCNTTNVMQYASSIYEDDILSRLHTEWVSITESSTDPPAVPSTNRVDEAFRKSDGQ